MDTEGITNTTQEETIASASQLDSIDNSQIESIDDTYQKIQALCNELSLQSKPLADQTTELLTQAQSLYDEAQRLTPNYKPPKNNTPQV